MTSVILALALTGTCAHNEVPDAPDVPDTPDTPAVDTKAPVIKVTIPDINVIDGLEVTIGDGELSIGSQVVATWADETTKKCKAEISVGGKSVSSGSILSEAGTLEITVTDDFDNKTSVEITLTAVAVFCIESLQNLSIKVDEEVDLLQGITIPNPNAFVQEYPATIGIILTLTRTDGKTIEVIADGLTVKPLDYNAPSLVVANMIEERFPWFTNRAIQTKEFVYGHLLFPYLFREILD